jgi:hypothetical protein
MNQGRVHADARAIMLVNLEGDQVCQPARHLKLLTNYAVWYKHDTRETIIALYWKLWLVALAEAPEYNVVKAPHRHYVSLQIIGFWSDATNSLTLL